MMKMAAFQPPLEGLGWVEGFRLRNWRPFSAMMSLGAERGGRGLV